MSKHAPAGDKAMLILGWQMDSRQEPKYWLSNDPKAGEQSSADLVAVPSDAIGSHTAIIAQSGSGKSFFLGRLVEEILLRTKARCIILDPNADFRKVYEVEDESLWESAAYDPLKHRGKLPHERSREEFERQWAPIRKATRVKIGTNSSMQGENYETLELIWSSLSAEVLAEEIDPMHRSDLYHCHTFAQDLELLYRLRGYLTQNSPGNLIDETEKLFQRARHSAIEFLSTLEEMVDVDRLINRLFKGPATSLFGEDSELLEVLELFGVTLPRFWRKWPGAGLSELSAAYEALLRARIRYLMERMLKAPKYVSEVVAHFYFSKAKEYQVAGILQTDVLRRPSELVGENRLEVIDLPSLKNKATILLAINTILSTEWERARREWGKALEKPLPEDDRVPTFIVVDEAHNLIPAETRGRAEYALREQFRTIVAEGRKYGLFLILVSQRPDKLDPLVLSECENKAIMRLSSGSVLDVTKQMLGLEDLPPKLLEKSLDFETGRALLIGRWSQDNPRLLYCAARRTVEGGRNLRDSYWASPPDINKRAAGSHTSKSAGARSAVKPRGKSAKAAGARLKSGASKKSAK
jgi:hypothetical protein